MSSEKRLKNQEDAHAIGFYPLPDATAAIRQHKKPRHIEPAAGL
jgi:hypothetical protein